MTFFQRILAIMLDRRDALRTRPQPVGPAVKVSEGGPQINPGPGDGSKPGKGGDVPLINPGPGVGYTDRVPTLGLGRRYAERPVSSRPFGVAQDDTLI